MLLRMRWRVHTDVRKLKLHLHWSGKTFQTWYIRQWKIRYSWCHLQTIFPTASIDKNILLLIKLLSIYEQKFAKYVSWRSSTKKIYQVSKVQSPFTGASLPYTRNQTWESCSKVIGEGQSLPITGSAFKGSARKCWNGRRIAVHGVRGFERKGEAGQVRPWNCARLRAKRKAELGGDSVLERRESSCDGACFVRGSSDEACR